MFDAAAVLYLFAWLLGRRLVRARNCAVTCEGTFIVKINQGGCDVEKIPTLNYTYRSDSR